VLLRTVCVGCLTLASAIPAFAQDGASQLGDAEGRIEYAYFVGDTRALEAVSGELRNGEPEAPQLYMAALADYRLATVRTESSSAGARAAAERCTDTAERAEKLDGKMTEAAVLRAACAGVIAAVTRVTAPLAGSSSVGHLRRALQAAPKNARVKLVELSLDFDRATNNKYDRARLVDRCREVVALFEAERRGPVQVPSWGAADAYVLLGRALLDQGDTLGARESFEQALLLAPEFTVARKWAARIISRN
jgi:tetratricopeptide (TPR) repeat protein